MAINDDWLAQVREDTIDPALPICDPHHHLWDHREGRVERRYLLDEILRDVQSGHTIVSTVFIEHLAMFRADGPEEMKYVGEVEFANGLAAMAASGLYGQTRVAAGIVGYADLAAGSRVRAVLEAEISAAPGRLRGIRCTGAWDPDPRIARAKGPGFYLDATFREGFAELDALGLSFDLTSRFHQLADCADLARAFPGTTMILNHLGGLAGIGAYAGRREEIFAAWRKSMADLAACPNVAVKLGGLAMDYTGFGWHERPKPPTSRELCDATRRYYETAIELFGPGRCMFESNFPVDKISCSYNVLWNSFKRVTEGYSAGEKAELYHDTAARVYRLG
ncbi:MAG: amidohydrolase family protein [Alphaproteobacteria bacterium]|nr:amidohydrolase family protein [Alphaproteobacteria bacterium]